MSNLIAVKTNPSHKNEVNPWVFSEADKKKQIKELEILIQKTASILPENYINWKALLPYFSGNFLNELKQTLIRENLRELSSRNIQKH